MTTPSSSVRLSLALPLLLAAACARTGTQPVGAADPRHVVEELLAADRRYSAAAASHTDAVAGISAMLADDVWMPTSHGDFARGVFEATAALRAALGPDAVRLEWVPVRGGISADGQQGFTFGYVTIHRRDTASTPAKYLSYWRRRSGRWQAVAFKLGRRPGGDVSLAMMAPSLPARLVPATADSATVDRHARSLVAAERAFSNRAQQIGLGPAFVEYGRADAMNLGGRHNAAFVVGNEAIGELVGAGSPRNASPVSWSADRAIVASSGDLGVTFGFIRQNQTPGNAEPSRGVPFFTIWRRGLASDPWRYIAE